MNPDATDWKYDAERSPRNEVGVLQVVAWTRTLTGEHGYVDLLGKKTMRMCESIDDAQRMTPEQAAEAVRRINTFVGTYAYTIGVTS